MQYRFNPLLRENPKVMAIVAKSAAEILEEMILDIIRDRFSSEVVSQVQQTVALARDPEQLKRFLHQLALVSDEQEVYPLLAHCFSLNAETKSCIECTSIRDSILDLVSARFSSQVFSQVQQTIILVQDPEQLRKLLRQLAQASDEQEVCVLIREDRTITATAARSEANDRIKGKIEVQQELILELTSDGFSGTIVSQVQQTITLVRDSEQLVKFIHPLACASDEQEVYALLVQCFPLTGEIRSCIERKCIQDSILDIVRARFSPLAIAGVQQTIAHIQDHEYLRKFLCELAQAPDDQEVHALIGKWYLMLCLGVG